MSPRWVAVASRSLEQALGEMARERAWLSTGAGPWRFSSGSTAGWLTPRGASVSVTDATFFGVHVVVVGDDEEGLVEELSRTFGLDAPDALASAWERATTADRKVTALLRIAGAQQMALATSGVLPQYEAAVAQALLDAHPVVRLAGIRALAIAPFDLASRLLEGKSDPDNPGLAEWRDLFNGAR